MMEKIKKKANGSGAVLDRVLQRKFVTGEAEMNAAVVGRHQEIRLMLTGAISQQHLLLVGPPGTAKSWIAKMLQKFIAGAKRFSLHCCKDTTRNASFGPVKISKLKNDVYERNLAGGIADAQIVIMEEVYRAGPAVLDMFLPLMNEREYIEGLAHAQALLKFLMGTSNTFCPDGCEDAVAAFS